MKPAPYVPRNSLGEPWQPGQRWRCDGCGQSGDDRDDVYLARCTLTPNGAHTAFRLDVKGGRSASLDWIESVEGAR